MRATAASLLAAVALAGCASSQATSDTQEIVAAGAIQYDGQFRPIQQSDGRLGMSTQQRIYGTVRIIYRESNSRSVVNLTLNTNAQQSEVLSWAVVPGRCGSGGVPVLPAAQFPPLEIGSTGRGDVINREVPIVLPQGAYHVNVYRGGETLTNVIACSNLTAKVGE
jgi:hypothetical protein